MTASVFSTLNGKLVGKHPTLGVLVSDDGMVLCLNKGSRWGSPNAKFHWTVGSLDSAGYRYVQIKKKNYWVHRLVAETFLPNPENKPTVDHYPNRDRTDNRLCNLRWADQKEQCRNTKSYDGARDLGVRKHDDPKEWDRRYHRYARANGLVKPLSEEQYKKKVNRVKERYANDPEFRQKKIESARAYRARKKAEQSAQPSV